MIFGLEFSLILNLIGLNVLTIVIRLILFTNFQFDWSKCVDNCDSTNTITIKGKYSTSMPPEQTKQNQLFYYYIIFFHTLKIQFCYMSSCLTYTMVRRRIVIAIYHCA